MIDCPSCGAEMERSITRRISITLSGREASEEEQLDDEAGPDELDLICPECGYKEKAEYRDGDDDEEASE